MQRKEKFFWWKNRKTHGRTRQERWAESLVCRRFLREIKRRSQIFFKENGRRGGTSKQGKEKSEKNFCNFLWGEQNFLREERGGSELKKKKSQKKKEAKKRQRTES